MKYKSYFELKKNTEKLEKLMSKVNIFYIACIRIITAHISVLMLYDLTP